MGKISEQVECLERDRDRLAREAGRLGAELTVTRRRLSRAAPGNIVLVDRNGFSRPMTVPIDDVSCRLYSTCDRPPMCGDFTDYPVCCGPSSPTYSVRHFENTGRRDEFGRWIYRER